MNIAAFILWILAVVFFCLEFKTFQMTRKYYWLSLGLICTVSMVAVQFLHNTRPIHF